MYNSHIALASRGEMCRETETEEENKPICKLKKTDYEP